MEAAPCGIRMATLRVVRGTYARSWRNALRDALLDPRAYLLAVLLSLPMIYASGSWSMLHPLNPGALGFLGAVGLLCCRHAAGLSDAQRIGHELDALPPRELATVGRALTAIDDLVHRSESSPRVRALVNAAAPAFVRCVLECARDITDGHELQRLHSFSGQGGVGPGERADAIDRQLMAWASHVEDAARLLVSAETDAVALAPLVRQLETGAVQLLAGAPATRELGAA